MAHCNSDLTDDEIKRELRRLHVPEDIIAQCADRGDLEFLLADVRGTAPREGGSTYEEGSNYGGGSNCDEQFSNGRRSGSRTPSVVSVASGYDAAVYDDSRDVGAGGFGGGSQRASAVGSGASGGNGSVYSSRTSVPGSVGLRDKAASTADTRAGNAPSTGAPPPRLPSAAPSATGGSATGSAGEGTGLGLSFYKVAVAVFVFICAGLRAAKRRLDLPPLPRLGLRSCVFVATMLQARCNIQAWSLQPL